MFCVVRYGIFSTIEFLLFIWSAGSALCIKLNGVRPVGTQRIFDFFQCKIEFYLTE